MVLHNGSLRGYNFHNVFGDRAKQEEVYAEVAEPLVNDSLLKGILGLTQERAVSCSPMESLEPARPSPWWALKMTVSYRAQL